MITSAFSDMGLAGCEWQANVNGPSSCNFDAFGGGVPRKAWLRFASINMSLTLTRLVPVDHRNDSVFIQSSRQSIQ